jgi:putative ABC transport system permease protein
MSMLLEDLKHALRVFRTAPVFAGAVVAAIALGIGANTAIFSVVDTVILKPVPFPEPDRIVQLQIIRDGVAFGPNTSPAKFMLWRELHDVFSDVAGFRQVPLNLTQGDVPELISAARVSEAYFRVFGPPIEIGRTFAPDEDLPSAAPTAVVSHAFWTDRLGADPKILGKTVSLGGMPHTVVGVAGAGFDMRELGEPEVWLPLQLDPATTEQAHFFRTVARLAPGVSLEQAQARIQTTVAAFRERYPTREFEGEAYTAVPLQDALVGNTGRTLWVLLGAVAFVLLIACANVANLLLVRAAHRRREIAIRSALGAGRRRIVQQLLTESVLLSVVGGALGVVIGLVAMRALLAINTAGLPRIGAGGAWLGLDWRVLTFGVALSLATGALFGLVPALVSARVDLNTVIKSAGSRSGRDRRDGGIRSGLVLLEIMLAVVLLIGASLLIRTSIELNRVDGGYRADHVLVLRTALSGQAYASTASVEQIVRTARERFRAIPGVVEAGAACCVPTEFSSNLPFNVIGREPEQGPFSGAGDFAVASPGYFETFRIPLLRGRSFTDGDSGGAPGVVLVNQAFVERFFRGANALGERVLIGGGRMQVMDGEPEREIVGIVGDVRNRGLDDEPAPTMYVPQAQLPDAFNAFFLGAVGMRWVVRTARDPMSMAVTLQAELRQIAGVPVVNVEPMARIVSTATSRERFNMLLMSVFGGAALLLAALGIYGLLAYSVEQRTQELGVRIALGAEPQRIRAMILRQGARLLAGGVAGGLVAAFYLSSLLASFLFGVEPRDGLVFTAVPLALTLIGLAIVAVVALRAGRVDPLSALRYE